MCKRAWIYTLLVILCMEFFVLVEWGRGSDCDFFLWGCYVDCVLGRLWWWCGVCGFLGEKGGDWIRWDRKGVGSKVGGLWGEGQIGLGCTSMGGRRVFLLEERYTLRVILVGILICLVFAKLGLMQIDRFILRKNIAPQIG